MSGRNTYLSTATTKGETVAITASAPPELEDGPPDRDAVAVLQRSLRHRRLVHHRAVGRSEIGQEVAVRGPADLGVLAGRPGVLEGDVGLPQPPDRHHVLVQRERLLRRAVL